MAIHQIYCTHCTYGSSAFERREGEMASRPFAHTARAGSLPAGELRKLYRQVERYLYYSLPADTPPEARRRLDAATAPCRLVYAATAGGGQLLSQFRYRTFDAAGQPGSYFGHVLAAERAAGAWPVLDCLKLWGAPFIDEDSPAIPFDLPALASLAEIAVPGRPAIDDGVLLGFLTAPAGGNFHDPRQLVPPRWKKTPPGQRQELLRDVLKAFLALGPRPKESVLVVVEPELAALVFYGVARLLPAGPLRDEISFSTYEPNPDRLPVALAATTFHDPATGDARPDLYRGRGYVINTYLKRASDHLPRALAAYATLAVGTLVRDGWPALDGLLAAFDAACISGAGPGQASPAGVTGAGPGQASPAGDDLERLVPLDAVAHAILDPAAPLADEAWRESPRAVCFLGERVRQGLRRHAADAAKLRALVGADRQMLLLDLAAAAPDAESQPAIRFLLENLPEPRFAQMLASLRISPACKAAAVAHFVETYRRFPAGGEALWPDVNPSGGPGGGSLMPLVLARLKPDVVESLAPAPADPTFAGFLPALARASGLDPAKVPLLGKAIAALPDGQLVEVLSKERNDLPAAYPRRETRLGSRLRDLLDKLPDPTREFSARLDVLAAYKELFPDPAEAERALDQWRKVQSATRALAALLTGRKAKTADLQDRGIRLASALRSAMPPERYPDGDDAARKQQSLRGLLSTLSSQQPPVPEAAWQNMVDVLQGGSGQAAGAPASDAAPAGGPAAPAGGWAPATRAMLRNRAPWIAGTALVVVQVIVLGVFLARDNWRQEPTAALSDPGEEAGEGADDYTHDSAETETAETETAPPREAPELSSPAAVAVEQGSSESFFVNVERNGFEGQIRLVVAGLPEKVAAAPVSMAALGAARARLTLTAASDAAEGTYAARLVATAGELEAERDLTVTVVKPALPALAPLAAVTLEHDGTASVEVTVERNGLPGIIIITVEGPENVKAPPREIQDGQDKTTLKLAVADAAKLEQPLQVQVVADAGGRKGRTTLELLPGENATELPVADEVANAPAVVHFLSYNLHQGKSDYGLEQNTPGKAPAKEFVYAFRRPILATKIKIFGLESLNRWCLARGYEFTTRPPDRGPLDILWQPLPASDTETKPVKMATLVLVDKRELLLRWGSAGGTKPPPRWIECLVVKVDTGSSTEYIALHKQVRRGLIPVEGGEAILHPDEIGPALARSDFLLGRGKLHLADGSVGEFSEPSADKPNLMRVSQALADELGVDALFVELGTTGSRGRWQFQVKADKKGELADKERELKKLRTDHDEIKANLKLAYQANNAADRVEAMELLAAKIPVPAPAFPVAKTRENSLRDFKDYIEFQGEANVIIKKADKVYRDLNDPRARGLAADKLAKAQQFKDDVDDKARERRLAPLKQAVKLPDDYAAGLRAARDTTDFATAHRGVRELATLIGAKQPRLQSDADKEEQRINALKPFHLYSADVMAKVLAPAEKLAEGMPDRLKALEEEIAPLNRDYVQKLKKVKSLSAILYRIVDGEVRVDDVIIGEP